MMCDMVEPAAKDQVLYCAQRAIICDWALRCGQGSTRKRRRQCTSSLSLERLIAQWRLREGGTEKQ